MISVGVIAFLLWFLNHQLFSVAASLEIKTEWNGTPLNHAPISITLSKGNNQNKPSLVIEVSGPYFGDPPAPQGPPGKPFPQLWDYEVAEVFFLGNNEKYLEVELSPHGQHLVLILSGRRKMVKDELPISYSSKIDRKQNTWSGRAEVPLEYLPPGVGKINAYAIHGSGKNRVYEALYPADAGKHKDPDFHRLEYFKPFDFSSFLTSNWKPSSLYDDK